MLVAWLCLPACLPAWAHAICCRRRLTPAIPRLPACYSVLCAEAGKQLDIVRSPLDLRDLVTDVHCIIEAMVGKEVSRASRPAGSRLAGLAGTVHGGQLVWQQLQVVEGRTCSLWMQHSLLGGCLPAAAAAAVRPRIHPCCSVAWRCWPLTWKTLLARCWVTPRASAAFCSICTPTQVGAAGAGACLLDDWAVARVRNDG